MYDKQERHSPTGATAVGDARGTQDGNGAADHDLPYKGLNRSLFTVRQMSRLLLLRGEVLAHQKQHAE